MNEGTPSKENVRPSGGVLQSKLPDHLASALRLGRAPGLLRRPVFACAAFFRRSLRTIRSRMITAFVLMVLLPAGAISLCSIIMAVESGKSQDISQLESVAALKQAEINTWLHNLEIDLLGLEEDGTLKDAALLMSQSMGSTAQNRLRAKLRERFGQMISLTKRFDELYIMSRDGLVALSTNQAEEGEFRGLQPYFSKGLLRSGVHVQTLAFSPSSEGLNAVVAVHPIKGPGGEAVGVVCGIASPAALNIIMSERTGLGKSGETYLVGANHVLMSVSRSGGFAPGQSWIDTEGLDAALKNRTNGTGIYTSYRHVPVIGVYRWLPGLDVALMAEREEAEQLAPIYTSAAINAGVGAFAVLLAVFASFFFARSISRPLAELARTATRIARGNLNLSADIERDDEVGSLARAFNSMTFQLSRRIEMEKLVSDLSRLFIGLGPAETDPAIERALANGCQFVGADQSTLFIFSEDGVTMDLTHQWRPRAGAPRIHGLGAAPLLWFPWLTRGLGKSELVSVPDTADLPPEAAEEKKAWISEGIRALVCVSLVYGGALRGFIEFEWLSEPESWSGEDLRVLVMVGEIIRSSLERRRSAEELMASEEKYRSIIENALEGIYRSTLQGRFLSVNPAMAEMLGYDSPQELIEELTDIRAQLYVDPRDRDEFLSTLLEKDSAKVRELHFYRKDATGIWASVNARLVRNKAGEPLFIEGFMRDITERKRNREEVRRLNEELEQRVIERTSELQAANRELEAFSYSVSHDLRTPLRSIDGFSQALIEDYFDQLDETGRDYLSRVRTASQHMGNLIDDLLRLSRVSRAEMTREEVDIGSLVGEIVEELRQREPGRKVDVEIDPVPPVKGDLRLVRIMLENLVGNAWKFTGGKPDARIEFGAFACGLKEEPSGAGADEAFVYFLRDNGAGFDMAYANKLFKAFNRLHSLNEFEGTGIGLAIVDRVIKRHGGSIRAEGEVGRGCVFYFSL